MVERYRVIFEGEIAPYADPQEARQKLAALYKMDIKSVERFFTGKRFVLKQNCDLDAARKFTEQFEKRIGARCSIVKMEGAASPQAPQQKGTPGAPVDKKESPPANQNKSPIRYESRYRLVFKGEVALGRDINEVKTNLSILYKVKPEKIEGFFTGKPVAIVESSDFWTVAGYLNRFKQMGAICSIDVLDTKGEVVKETEGAAPVVVGGVASSEPAAAPEQDIEQEVQAAPLSKPQDSEKQRIKTASKNLYNLINRTYQQILQEYRIEKKVKQFDTNEGILGCFSLLVIAAAIIAVVSTPLRWYWALLGTIGIFAILVPVFSKEWDTRYADAFLGRLEIEKNRDFPLFAATMNKWIGELPDKDKAKVYLSGELQKMIKLNFDHEEIYQKYVDILGKAKPVKSAGGTAATNDEVPKSVICPRCGSNLVNADVKGYSWGTAIVTSAFLGPLGGYIAGNMGRGRGIYRCVACGKKWNR